MTSEARIPCSRETRDEVLRPLKTGGQTFDELLREMAAQYEPERPSSEAGDSDE